MRVCIAIPTFRRPALLRELLAALSAQVTAVVASVEVAVIDNDPRGSAKSVVNGFAAVYPVPLHYRLVPTPGVSSVRNDAIVFAATFDALVMIDDDEVPESQWLAELLRVQEATQADAVIGPVMARLPVDSPPWLGEGRFFEHRFPVPDRYPIRDGHTGNCLIKVPILRSLHLTFDPLLNMSGGEDTLFFRQLVHRGGKMVYAAAAIATETVSESRTTVRYLLWRHLRWGATLSFCDRVISGKTSALAHRLTKAMVHVALGAIMVLPGCVWSGRAGSVLALCRIARGSGMILGLTGLRVRAYRRIEAHPSEEVGSDVIAETPPT